LPEAPFNCPAVKQDLLLSTNLEDVINSEIEIKKDTI
jgi:hypothetical protein